ncbi:protein phosphatase 1 regulatory subunit 27-like [Haliotis rufescens]|uniref:protein phosphatase 1 regulatory subunit 27-like n=1 Tax=Haliotis rufescens TaxID=6454 RepID=UPI00201EAC36|nr:protein phosphatase 1 regulatory subunit 27-like [Haliotis rufescens]
MTSSKRKISFPPDSVLTAIIQDGDIAELTRILQASSPCVDVNTGSHTGLTALHHGVLSNNLDAVKLLLTHGARVNTQDIHGFTPLHTASACGFLQVASMLLLYGADVFALTRQSELPIDLAKDIGVVRLISEEMTRQIHAELFVPSIVIAKFWELCVLCQKIIILLLTLCSQKLKEVWHRYRRKQD